MNTTMKNDIDNINEKEIETPVTSSSSQLNALNGKTSSTAPEILKASLVKFFSNRDNIEKFLPIVNRTSHISLRLLDYFCVNYARSNPVVYMVMDKYFDVHSSYKNQLKTFTKKMFDPFKRNSRITIRYDNERFDTTLGQLSFFKWCINHKVLEYVDKNLAMISEDMKKNSTNPPEDIPNQPDKKRRSSRRTSAMNATVTRIPAAPGMDSVIVSFD